MAAARLLPAIAVVSIALAARGVSATSPGEKKKAIELHGWLMWVSMGVLLPVGIILLRYSRNQTDATGPVSHARVRVLFLLHSVTLGAAALLALAGMLLLIVKVGPFWEYTHERLGLALVVLMLIQPFIGFARPRKYHVLRPYWYLLHWAFGTGAVFLGVVNIYIGVRVYEMIFQTSIRTLNILFSIQISAMCMVYLLQDRWHFIFRNQRVASKADPQLKGDSVSY